VIVGERIVVGVFVVITVNTIMRGNLGVRVGALVNTEVSVCGCVVLTHGCCLRL
jgi:hypothetical protein